MSEKTNKSPNKLFVLLSLLLMLTGCSSTSPSFDDMSRTYQTVIEKYDRNGLFLNIVRASKKAPLSFLTIPSITGSGSIAQSIGVDATVVSTVPGTAGGFLSAGTGSYYAPSLGVSLSRGFTFTQSSLDNAAFQKSFMSEIPLAAINAISKSADDRRELVYSLILNSILLVSPDGSSKTLQNDPNEPGFDEFQLALHLLIKQGLSTEILEVREPVGPTMSATQVNDIIFKYLDAKDDKNLSLENITQKGDKEKTFQIYQLSKKARFCFNKGPNAEQVSQMYGAELFCSEVLDTLAPSKPIQAETAKPRKQYELGFNVRSTAGVFNYLGNVIKLETQPTNPKITKLKGNREVAVDDKQINSDVPILLVQKNKMPTAKVFAEIEYEGDSYYIPAENAGYSSQVMSILYGFVALNKVPGSIPNSPAVLIK